jgi:hypothetical protein
MARVHAAIASSPDARAQDWTSSTAAGLAAHQTNAATARAASVPRTMGVMRIYPLA